MPTQSPPPVPPQPALAGADAALAGVRVSRRWSTGKLLFVVLTIALAPLGAIAFGAATRTIGTSDVEREMLLQVAVNETAQRVTRLLDANSTRLIQTLQAVTRRQVRSEPSGIEMPDAAIIEPAAKSAEEKRADTIAAACTAAATEFPEAGTIRRRRSSARRPAATCAQAACRRWSKRPGSLLARRCSTSATSG